MEVDKMFKKWLYKKAIHDVYEVIDVANWSKIQLVIESLEELKKNTWDKSRVQRIQNDLRLWFEVRDEDNNRL